MILVLGSINMDLFFAVGSLPKVGETVLCAGAEMRPGGKGANQAYAAARSGAQTAFVGCVGDDAFGPAVRAALSEGGCDVSRMRVVDRPTGTAAVMVEVSGENQIVVASGANLAVSAGMVPDDLLGPGTTLVCQMEIPVAETEAALIRAKTAGARTILNLAPAAPISGMALAAVDVLVVNEIEARMLAPDEPSIEAMARRLSAAHGLTCIITLGADGAFVCEAGSAEASYSAPKIEPVDTVGAGDAFVGALAAALDEGLPISDALPRALMAGAITCTRHGAMTAPTASEIEAALG
jgi:ribokinase